MTNTCAPNSPDHKAPAHPSPGNTPQPAPQSLIQRLTQAFAEAFAAAGHDANLGHVVRSDRAPFQCNGAMAAAKKAKANPRDIAGGVIAALPDGFADIADVEVAGPGFLNITPKDAVLTEQARTLAADERAGAGTVAQPKTIVLDFGGANVAKPMHVGHLRSAVIGDTLQRLFTFRGERVISDVHLGDWGLQMGHLISELAVEQPNLSYFDDAASGPFPSDPPVTMDDLARLYPQASAAAKADPDRLQASRRATAKMQAGHAGYRALLQHFIDVSVAALKVDYGQLNVSFDLWKGESDVDPLVPDVVAQFQDKSLVEDSEGAKIIRVAREGDKKDLPPLILVTSEGSALYGTTDLATILDRVTHIKPDQILYVVDLAQADHFEQVFRAAAMVGWMEEGSCEHIKFGTVNGTDGKRLRTREGGTFRLADLIDQAQTRAGERIAEAGLAGDLSAEEQAKIAKMVATAALRFADLQNVRTTNYVFDLDRFLSFEGKTGPYLLYAAVRLKSLLRKATEQGVTPGDIMVATPEERALVRELDNFDAALARAHDARHPHIICEHAYNLGQAFSKFYAECPVLGAADDATKASRLALSALTLKQLTLTLDILGIETPERM